MYQLTTNGVVIRLADSACIPVVKGNRDYEEFLAWEQDGGIATVLQPSPTRGQQVTPKQFRLALNQMGLRPAIEAAVAAADQDTKDVWEYATFVARDNQMLVSMAKVLGKTDAEIDAVFALADTL